MNDPFVLFAEFFVLEGATIRCKECNHAQPVVWGTDAHGFPHASDCSCSDPLSSAPAKPWPFLVDAICQSTGYERPEQPIEPEDWNPIDTAPVGDTERLTISVRAVTVCDYRWEPYKPTSAEARRGLKGRWQIRDNYEWSGWRDEQLPIDDAHWTLAEVDLAPDPD
jgi:hypothetical protein